MNLQQILAAVRTKYANFGLSEAVLLKLAESILAGLKPESTTAEMDAEIVKYESLAKTLQSDADRIRTETAAKAKADAEKAAQQAAPAQPATPPAGGTQTNNDALPAWFATWSAQNDQRFAALEGKQTAGSREKQLNDVLAGASDTFKQSTLKSFGRMNFKDEQDFANYLEELKADVTANPKEAAKADNSTQSGNNFVPGGTGGGGGKADTKAIDAQIKAWATEGQEGTK